MDPRIRERKSSSVCIVSCARRRYTWEPPCVGMHAALFVPSARTFSHFRSGSSIRDFAGTDGASLRIVGAIVGGRDEGEEKRNSLHRGRNLLKKRESRKQDIHNRIYN